MLGVIHGQATSYVSDFYQTKKPAINLSKPGSAGVRPDFPIGEQPSMRRRPAHAAIGREVCGHGPGDFPGSKPVRTVEDEGTEFGGKADSGRGAAPVIAAAFGEVGCEASRALKGR